MPYPLGAVIDPRIYRAALLPVVFALIVVAFSLREQPAPLGTTLAPDAFSGARAARTASQLTAAYPNRRPGSSGDRALAGRVGQVLARNGFTVSTERARGRTAVGTRPLATVVGERVGFTQRRLVVVADRTALARGSRAQMTSTAALLELARAFGGRTPRHTITLISTDGDTGAAAAAIHALGGPVDAVLAVGDLGGDRLRRPFVVPWSDGGGMAPPALVRTVGGALRAEANVATATVSPLAQFARQAFPLTPGAQGRLAAAGLPAVLVSASGERGPGADAAISADRLAGFGRGTLRALTALDGGAPSATAPAGMGRAGPAPYLTVARKIVPAWAVRLLVAALIFPALVVAVDCFARARRRREPTAMWLRWLAAGTVPFLVGAIFVGLLALTGLLGAVPPTPVAGAVPLGAGRIVALVSVGLVLALGWLWLRPLVLRRWNVRGDLQAPGAAVATLLALSVLAVAVWIANPFAAALLVPALHLWLLGLAPDLRLRRGLATGLVVLALAPVVLLVAYYMSQFGLGPIAALWTMTLLVAGGQVGVGAVVATSALAGCVAGALAIVLRRRPAPHLRAVPAPAGRQVSAPSLTVSGPGGYAGPGALGGTESALHR